MAEMLEADRKGKWSKDIIKSLTERDGNLIHGMSIEQAHQFIITTEDFLGWFKETVKDTAEDELADVVIRITSYLAAYHARSHRRKPHRLHCKHIPVTVNGREYHRLHAAHRTRVQRSLKQRD